MISMRWQCCAKRSTSATTQAAPGNVVPHCLKPRLVVMIVERLVASADDIVEDVCGSGVAGQVSDLIKDKQVRARVTAQTTLEGGQRFLPEQVSERCREGREPYGEAGGERGLREILRNHGLAEAGATLEQYVFSAVDEAEVDEALDEWAIDLLGVSPVEAVDRLERSETREPRAAREIHGNPGSLLEIDELLDRLGRANAALVDVREECSEGLATDAKAEAAEPLGEIVATHRRPPGRVE